MSKQRYASIHIVGLGGTGANIIQALIESDRLSEHIASEDSSIACLSIDVADGDLANLQKAYKETIAKLEARGTSIDRLWVKPFNIKFNTPDSLFEFMEKYDQYLAKDGVKINNYKPWIQSSISIPPLAGGVGRMRALSKAVYCLNYYHYVEINSVMSIFKDKIITSKYQPIILIIFGLGGGTGSGMVIDFAKHLRSKIGTAIPIIGLAILPSAADDLLARGPAPYNSLLEFEMVFNRGLNEVVIEEYGEKYQNPFTAFFFLPLDPVYNNRGNLVTAKEDLDMAIVNIISIMMNFDLADLLSRVGTNNDFGPNWVHTLSYLRIRYPVDDYIKYIHNHLALTDELGIFLKSKKEALVQINEIIKNRYNELVELYRSHLVTLNTYNQKTFEAEIEDAINRVGKYDIEFKKQVRGIEDFAQYYNEKWTSTLKAMAFPEDSVEYSVLQQIAKWRDSINNLSKNYESFLNDIATSLSDIESTMTACRFLTASHIRQIRSYMNLVQLVSISLDTARNYLRAKLLADELVIRYGKNQTKEGQRALTIGEAELIPLFKAVGYILTKPETEVKVSDQYLPGIRVIKKNIEKMFKDSQSDLEYTNSILAQKQLEIDRLKKNLKKIRIDINGRKKTIKKNIGLLETELSGLTQKVAQKQKQSEQLHNELEKISELEKSLEITSLYRKSLNTIVNKFTELNNMMSNITFTNSYYERVVELSDIEQIKIMERILKEEETTLKGGSLFRDIIDRDRFKEMVKGHLRIFSVSNYSGLIDTYRTDLIWAIVSMPSELWDHDLQSGLSNILNIYSSVEGSKSISIKQIPQIDPWTITFLIILAKARISDIERFASMKSDSASVRKAEKTMFRSFLIEHGIQDIETEITRLNAIAEKR
ncbi:MAG: tubulin-like doman-containing protein [Candidatus Bathyarchaeia archaeon]